MSGGYTGQLKKVSKDDITQAGVVLSKKLLSETENSLKSSLSSDDILLDNAILSDVISAGSDIKPDTITDKFNISAKVKVSALVFKKQDLEKFAKDYILSQLSSEQTFLEKSLNFSYIPVSVDVKMGGATLDLKLFAKTYQDINTNDLIDFLSLKSADQIKETVNRMYDNNISDVKINFWPFWVNKSPKDKNKIKIDLLFQ